MIDKDKFLTLERPKSLCSECGAALEELERHPSGLRLGQNEQERRDFCPDCWEFAKNEAFDSYWVTKRVRKPKQLPKLSRREKAVALRALFESLWDQREQEEVDVHLFFLSHLLLRWGGLRWKDSETDADGREVVIFENPVTGDPIEVRAVEASDETILEIKKRIEEFLMQYAPEGEIVLD